MECTYIIPYYTYIVKTEFLNNGITYEKLSKVDQERFEDDFEQDGDWPDFIPSQALNKFVFNELTVDKVYICSKIIYRIFDVIYRIFYIFVENISKSMYNITEVIQCIK